VAGLLLTNAVIANQLKKSFVVSQPTAVISKWFEIEKLLRKLVSVMESQQRKLI